MAYRCPYCKQPLQESPAPRCPACGRTMIVPRMRESDARHTRRRVIENIRRESERRKAELRVALTPGMLRNPRVAVAAIALLALLGAALFRVSDQAVVRRRGSPHLKALRHLDVLAQALGRYRFHTGQYPAAEQGLAALVREPAGGVAGWDGPYISLLRPDPWGSAYGYAVTAEALPQLFSLGPDRAAGTADDLRPDPARFDPGTEWTNGWVSAGQRLPGVTVLPEPVTR